MTTRDQNLLNELSQQDLAKFVKAELELEGIPYSIGQGYTTFEPLSALDFGESVSVNNYIVTVSTKAHSIQRYRKAASPDSSQTVNPKQAERQTYRVQVEAPTAA